MNELQATITLIAAIIAALSSLGAAILAARVTARVAGKVYQASLAQPTVRTGSRDEGFRIWIANPGGRPVTLLEFGVARIHEAEDNQRYAEYVPPLEDGILPAVLAPGDSRVYTIPWNELVEWISRDAAKLEEDGCAPSLYAIYIHVGTTTIYRYVDGKNSTLQPLVDRLQSRGYALFEMNQTDFWPRRFRYWRRRGPANKFGRS